MKTVPQILGLLLAPLFCFSQNWNLISSDRVLNFGTSPGDQVVAKSIYVEQAEGIGADSVFRVGPRSIAYSSSYPYVTQVGNLLADSIVQKPGGLYEFHFTSPSDPNATYLIKPPFFIHSQAQPGESWMFQDTISAQVTTVAAQTVLGAPDSIKTIALSNGDTLLLSRNFGIVRFGAYTLIGLQGTGNGVQLPDNLDWYDWAPGEVFQYEIFSGNNYDISAHSWTKLTVLAKTLSPTAITFSVRRLTKRESTFSSNPPTVTYEDVVEPFVINNPAQVDYPGYTAESFCTFRSCNYQQSAVDISKVIDQLITPCSNGPQTSATFKTGLGRTQYYFNYNALGGGTKTDEHLIGYQKLGQTAQGTIFPNSFFNAATDTADPQAEQGPRIFPNPARHQATLRCDSRAPVSSVEMYNAAGQKVRVIEANAFEVELPLEGLSGGVYYVKIRSGKDCWTRNLVIEGF